MNINGTGPEKLDQGFLSILVGEWNFAGDIAGKMTRGINMAASMHSLHKHACRVAKMIIIDNPVTL